MNVLEVENIDKKVVVFQATLGLIKDHGFHGTSMSMISKASETAIGTIYHYFSSKDDLIFALLDYTKQSGLESSFGKDDKTLSYYIRFKLLWKNFFKHMIQRPEMLSYITQFYSSPYSIRKCEDTYCFQGEFEIFIKGAQKENYVQEIPHEIISSIFLGSLVNTAKQYEHGTLQLSDKEMDILVDIIWNGIKVK